MLVDRPLHVALALAVVLAARPCLAATRIPLAEEHRKAITSVRIVANLAQEELGVTYRAVGWNDFGGSLGAQIARGIINENRERDAKKAIWKLDDALGAFDPRPRMRTALEQELGKLPAFARTKIDATQQAALAGPAAGLLAGEGGADAVLVLDYSYGFNAGLEYLVVSVRATLLPTASAADPALKKAFGSSTRELPVTPLYQAVLMTSMPAPGEDDDEVDRWMVNGCAPARLGIEGGIVELARMLAWDLEQGGPAGPGSLFGPSYPVPREKRVELPQFEEDFEAAPTRTQGDRVWYRSKRGELASVGDTYRGVELTPMSAFAREQAAPVRVAPPETDAAGRVTFGFASPDLTLQGGAVRVTQYSEREGDVAFDRKRFADGVLVVAGQVGFRKGSGFAGMGPRWELQQGGAPVDVRKFPSVTVRLGASTRALRVRLVGRVPRGEDDSCHPVYTLEDVEETVREFTIPLARFAPESWCGRKAVEVKEILPELTGLEVVSTRITTRPLTIRVGPTTFNP